MYSASAKIIYKVTFAVVYYGGTAFFAVADAVNRRWPNTIKTKRSDIPAPRGYGLGRF